MAARIVPREIEGFVYVETVSDHGVSYVRWCEVLGDPSVDYMKRGWIIARAIELIQQAESILGRSVEAR